MNAVRLSPDKNSVEKHVRYFDSSVRASFLMTKFNFPRFPPPRYFLRKMCNSFFGTFKHQNVRKSPKSEWITRSLCEGIGNRSCKTCGLAGLLSVSQVRVYEYKAKANSVDFMTQKTFDFGNTFGYEFSLQTTPELCHSINGFDHSSSATDTDWSLYWLGCQRGK